MKDNSYMRSYMISKYHRRRNEAIKRLGSKCIKCKTKENLQIDHIDRNNKNFGLSKAFASWSHERIEKELKKCQLLCSECHKDKTRIDLNQKDAKTIHGTLSSYRYCKCSLCKSAKSKHNREYKQRKRMGL